PSCPSPRATSRPTARMRPDHPDRRRMATRTTTTLDRTRIAELTAKEQRRLDERTPGSREMYERARQALVGGVASAYQERDPWPLYRSHGERPRGWAGDVVRSSSF